ncbi:hypothetical protein EGW08_006705 [Elysia chlorotica]|uniref:Uncharacterized protein n=1 Tax=Elysia chlorotica TaxID=188477 RepID=A0A433TV82_ELYCH|nr:hypothetical protein EGW08_006705 [Elysia chlorotica]
MDVKPLGFTAINSSPPKFYWVNNLKFHLPHPNLYHALNDFLTTIAEDSVYQEMRCHFFMTGKGRRPKLPSIILTNKLLLQLFGLKVEKGATWMEMTKWFQQLLPSQPVTMGKLEHRVEKLLTSVDHLFQEGRDAELPHFLDTALDFDQLPQPLACLGLTRTVLLADPSNFALRRERENGIIITYRIVHDIFWVCSKLGS